MESTNNRSFVPLLAGRVYIGTYDSVSEFKIASVSCLSDKSCNIVCYQSQNKVQQFVSSYTTTANVQFTQIIPLTNPFVEFSVRNTDQNDSTVMNFTVIYSANQTLPVTSNKVQVADTVAETYLQSIANGLSAPLKTKISDSTGADILVDSGGNLRIAVESSVPVKIEASDGTNIIVANGGLQVGLLDNLGAPFTQSHTTGALDVNISSVSSGPISVQTQTGLSLDSSVQTLINQNLNNGGTLWLSTVVSDGDNSTSIDLSTKQVVTASFFGNIVCDPSDTPTILIYYSADNTTFYASQNTMQGLTTGGGNFSLDCISNAHFIRAKVTGLTTGGPLSGTVTMYLNCRTP